ncbi:MAG: Rieske (2Fe-2S) protein, partial [Gemmatimonadaceae bacterium]
VSVRLHGAPAPGDPSYDGVRRDIEESLSAGLLGFQELEIRNESTGRAKATEPTFLSLQSLQRAQRPVYREVCAATDLPDGRMRSAIVDGVNVLVAHVGDEFFAVRNACGESPLPLDFSTLHETQLTCSWHSCVYDIRTGRRIDRPQASREEWLTVFPVREREGIIEIVVGTSAMSAGAEA